MELTKSDLERIKRIKEHMIKLKTADENTTEWFVVNEALRLLEIHLRDELRARNLWGK